MVKNEIFDIPFRLASFTKNDINYTAEIYTLINPEDTPYKGRVILLHNPGEDVALYKRTIERFSLTGYETFFYQMKKHYKNEDEITREMNRIIKICVDDLDQLKNIPNHKIHLVGNFITGTKALNYTINGRFRYRIKSVVSINPLIDPTSMFNRNSFINKSISLTSKIRPSVKLKYTNTSITSNQEFLNYLENQNYDLSFMNFNDLKYLNKIISKISKIKYIQASDKIKNLFIIQSKQNKFIEIENTRIFFDRIQPLPELSRFVIYEKGKANLFLENDEIFQSLMNDILDWFEYN
ncbi:hypothetical protein WICMUC_002351 [Wickerhamomyces mucosus]|uniref:Serine aminopeptidase S33 domain-containing protein n=1 Tax=Wickerhamomyces mucosus TaxID=1378264 RepID=A0A9P8TEP6_9ASCO|nr:hypothetical protein WICMUC_002351 [Wickerhamomyces mucosus]